MRIANCTPRHREATRRPSHILRDRHYVLFYCSFVALFCLGSGHRRPLLTSASVFIGALNTSHKYKKHNNSNRCQQRTIPAALAPQAPIRRCPDSVRRAVHGGGCGLRIPPLPRSLRPITSAFDRVMTLPAISVRNQRSPSPQQIPLCASRCSLRILITDDSRRVAGLAVCADRVNVRIWVPRDLGS